MSKLIPAGTHWRFINNHLVTCLDNGAVTVNVKIIAEVVADSISAENKRLIEAAPDLVALLESLRTQCEVAVKNNLNGGFNMLELYKLLDDAINKAKGE